MTIKTHATLRDIIDPPANRWLQQLAAGQARLPAGVRVLRHDTSDLEPAERRRRLAEAWARVHTAGER